MSFRNDLDPDKIPVTRPRLGVDGRRFFILGFSFRCSHGIAELLADDFSGGEVVNISSQFSVDPLKADMSPAASPAEAVLTRVRFWPPYTYDLKAGQVHRAHSVADPTEPVQIFAQLAPRIPAAYGGQVAYVAGVDLRFHSEFTFDGVTTTTIPYVDEITPSNEIEILVKHPAGYAEHLFVMLEIFR